MKQIQTRCQDKVVEDSGGMDKTMLFFSIGQKKTLRHDVVKSVLCRTDSLKSGREELCDMMS